jgi:EpsI family protein
VIAMIAYGALVANVCYVSWRRRATFMAMALIVPVLANGVRAFGTIYAAHLTSVEQATGYDHIVYGWVFFGAVMAAVLAIGWKWFDRDPRAPWFDAAELQGTPRHCIDLMVGAALVLTVAAVFPTWSAGIAGRSHPIPGQIDLPIVSGWQRAPVSTRAPWAPSYPAADHFLFGRYINGRHTVDLSLAVFASQSEGKEVVSFGTGVLREDDVWVRIEDQPPIAGGSVMRITRGPVERIVATWYVVGDVVTSSEKRVKLETLKARLLGGKQRAAAIHLSAEVVPGADPRAEIAGFAEALGPFDRLVDTTIAEAR